MIPGVPKNSLRPPLKVAPDRVQLLDESECWIPLDLVPPILGYKGEEILVSSPVIEETKLSFGTGASSGELDEELVMVARQSISNMGVTGREESQTIEGDKGLIQPAMDRPGKTHVAPSEFRSSRGHFNERSIINEIVELGHGRKIQKIEARLFYHVADAIEIARDNPGDGRLRTEEVIIPRLSP